MMKISNKVLGALLLALVFSFAACKDGSPAADEPILQKSALATVVVNVDGVARTLVPDATGLKYRLVLTKSSEIVSDEVITGSSITKELEPGYWYITVWALTDDDSLVGTATQNSVQLKAGETTKVSLTIQPLSGQEAGAGTFSWDFVLPEEEGLYTWFTTKTLTPYSNSANNNNVVQLVEASGSLELPAGRYELNVTAVSNRQINNSQLKAVRKEVVYIYPHLTTNAPFNFTVADFGAEMYFSGRANIYYNSEGIPAYTPTQVELQLADGVKTAPITLNTDNDYYVWAIEDVASNEIDNYLSNAWFRFTATATGNKVIHSPWQSVSLSELSGKTDIELTASVYKIDTSNLALYKGGTVTIPSEAAAGDQVTLTVKPNTNYGVDETNIINWASAHYTESDSNGRKYTFTMSNYEKTFPFNIFFQLTGNITITGTGYKPTKIEAWEITEGDELIQNKIGEGTPALSSGKYGWRINPNSYVYNNVYGEQKKIELRVTLTSDDEKTSYTVKETRDISSLYEQSTVDLPISLYEIYNFKTSPETIEAITLSWDKADWAAGGYNIYRRTGSNEYDKVNTNPIPIATTTYKDSAVSVNTAYDYYIVGVGGETVQKHLYNVQLQYPTPANVTATFNGGYPLQNYVSWDAVTPTGGYTVYYRILRNGTVIDTTTSTYYYDSNSLSFNSNYTYTVVAFNYSGYDSEASAATSTITTPPLSSYYGGNLSPSIASGEYQYYQVNDSSYWNYSNFYLNYTNVYLYVRLYSSYSSDSNYYSSSGSFGIYNNTYSVILIVQNQSSSDGYYSFSVQN
jgi:hypothetical protein